MRRTRVLLSAYQCAPGQGSVSQIGWEWYSRLAIRADVTLLTHVRNRAALEGAGAPLHGSTIIYVDTEWFAGPIYRLATQIFPRSQHAVFLLSSVDFYVYDYCARRHARKARQQWDVVHAVTPVSPLAATSLFKLGLPLVVGPWNGGMESPRGFAEIMREESAWTYRIRRIGHWVNHLVGCTRNAAVVLSATRATDRSVPATDRVRVRRMLENSVNLRLFYPIDRNSELAKHEDLRIIFVGRLIPVKGISMLLEAISRVIHDFPLEFVIVGDGPLRPDLERQVTERNLRKAVTFTGDLPLDAVADLMRTADVLCLPSVRESGGAVLLEAMACGVPVAAVDYGGPAELVDEEVGRLLSSLSPEHLVSDLARLIRDLFNDPVKWRDRGLAGRQRVEERYAWDAKIDEALEIYRQLSSGAGGVAA